MFREAERKICSKSSSRGEYDQNPPGESVTKNEYFREGRLEEVGKRFTLEG